MLEKLIADKHLRPSTVKIYRTAITQYENFHDMTIEELIQEAWDDEDKYSKLYQRNINNRIRDFRTALIDLNTLETSTINTKIRKIKAFYTHYGVILPNIKHLKTKTNEITYFDLPNKNHITMACNSTGILNTALILFMASSGTARAECAAMTINDFVQATQEYHNGGMLEEILDTLYRTQEPIVPTFYLLRQKTNKKYYTFCTPEATFAIIRYLKHRIDVINTKNEAYGENNQLEFSDLLFGVTERSITDRLGHINDKLHFGKKGKNRFFRAHTLRKFHASNIGLSEENIDMLQGRGRGRIHDTYIKANPKYLKKLYMNVMNNVTINLEEQRTVVNEEYHIHVHIHCDNGGATIF